MFPSDYLIFLQIILFLFITPGLPRIVIVSHTLNYGLKRSIWTAVGDVSANTLQGILIVFIIDEEVYRILNELAESNGLPKEYADRVAKHNANIELIQSLGLTYGTLMSLKCV